MQEVLKTTMKSLVVLLLTIMTMARPPLVLCQEELPVVSYSASDDASWAIHSTRISSLLNAEKQSIYDDYMENCNQAAMEDQKREQQLEQPLDPNLCTFNDEQRMRMNREQPSSVYNYTHTGFTKIRTPPKLFQLIQDFYHANQKRNNNNNKHSSEVEWSSVNSYQNLWDIPSTIVRLEDGRLKGGGENLKAQVWEQAQGILEEWIHTGQSQEKHSQESLTPVSLYGVREYHRGSLLAPHVDRMPLIISAIINVDQQGMDEPWPLEVYGHDGQATNVTMEVGDMILYESHSVIHGRPFPLQGDLYANIFLHFEPAINTNTAAEDSESAGLPPYIIPGSKCDSHWRAEHPNGWLPGVVGDPEDNEEDDWSAREAVFRGDVDMMRELLEEDHESLHEPDRNGWRPLHEAVRAGNVEMVQILLDHGADVNQETSYQQNPLSISLNHHGLGHEMTELLLEMGAVDAGPDL